MGSPNKFLRRICYFSDAVSFIEVAVESILVNRNIAVDDVSILKRTEVRNPVADDFVDTCANALWKLMVVERTWVGVVLNDDLMNNAIDLVCRHSDLNSSMRSIKCKSSNSARLSNSFYLFFSVDWYD